MAHEAPKPLDLAHHFSNSSKKRVPNVLKEYYKFLRIPEMGNLAGGMFHRHFHKLIARVSR